MTTVQIAEFHGCGLNRVIVLLFNISLFVINDAEQNAQELTNQLQSTLGSVYSYPLFVNVHILPPILTQLCTLLSYLLYSFFSSCTSPHISLTIFIQSLATCVPV